MKRLPFLGTQSLFYSEHIFEACLKWSRRPSSLNMQERAEKICHPSKPPLNLGWWGQANVASKAACEAGILKRSTPHSLSFQDPHVITGEIESMCFSVTCTSHTQSCITRYNEQPTLKPSKCLPNSPLVYKCLSGSHEMKLVFSFETSELWL